MQGFFKTCVGTYNVFVKFVDGKMQLHQAFQVSNLLHQFHFEERSFVQVESKLISTKLKHQACEENIFLVKVHTLNTSKTRLSLKLQTSIVEFWSKLKLGCITFACLIPIARPTCFEKKCHLCSRLPFLR
jgi:hypothetical protein